MLDLRTGKEMTRRETIKGGLGLAAILAAGKAPAYLLGARGVAYGKARGLSARSYIGGDALLLDAIENQGFDLPHQNEELKWIDCSHGYHFRRTHGTWAWTDLALTSTFTDRFASVSNIQFNLVSNYTIEYLVISQYSIQNAHNRLSVSLGGLGIGINTSGYGFFSTFNQACASGSSYIGNWGCPWTIKEILNGFYSYSVSVSNGTGTWRRNGGSDGKVFSSSLVGSSTDSSSRSIHSTYGLSDYSISAIRLTSRGLTADEIAHNYVVDKARYGLPL